jgi:hypothetical protein
MELIIVSVIVLFVISYTKMVDFQEVFSANGKVSSLLKEKDYDFYAMAKYGGEVDINALYNKRIKNTGLVIIIGLIFLVFNFTWINLIIVCLVVGVVYKSDYTNLKGYYKKHLQQIDQLLPYYLKSIEILAQHYTIPVAISKSINTAPDVFKLGLRRMIEKIDSGDSSIDPYMAFAEEFPVRDSMRMMRLLYRLSIGAQDNKQEQLLVFSKSVSSLQNKSREKMYAARLKKMENKTLVMLMVTGGGTMLVIFLAMMMMMF